jgi:hypothetical protein
MSKAKMDLLTRKAQRVTEVKARKQYAFEKQLESQKEAAEEFFAKYLSDAPLDTLIELSIAMGDRDIQRYNEIMEPIIRRKHMQTV